MADDVQRPGALLNSSNLLQELRHLILHARQRVTATVNDVLANLPIRIHSEIGWYMKEAASQGWTTRALERQISTLHYERLLATSDKGAVTREAQANIKSLQTPRDCVRDPVMLEFLGVPGTEKLLEADLERALLNNLQAFLLELGRGFAFVARQYRLSTETKDFFLDLVFYNFLLQCFVLFETQGRRAHSPGHRADGDVCPNDG